MSRIALLLLASLIAAAAITLPAARDAPANGGPVQTTSPHDAATRDDATRRETNGAATAHAAAAPRAAQTISRTSTRVAAGNGWSHAQLVAAFAAGAACVGGGAWLRSALRRHRRPSDAAAASRAASDAAMADPPEVGDWQMLNGEDNDLVTLHDAEGFIRYASSALLELSGYARHELVGRQGRDLVHDDDLPMLLAAVHAARDEPKPSPTLFRVLDRNGAYLWLEAEFRHSVSRTGEPEMTCVARSVARGRAPPVVAAGVRTSSVLDEVRGPSLQDLCHAFERREFELHYQLKVGLADWRVTGVEALLRWNTPEGSGRTAEIIASAERTGFIVTLGEWVVRAAAHQSLEWRRAGLRYPVAVNVSPVQLHDPGFVPLMRELIARDRELPAWLELEVTEQALTVKSDRAVQTIAQLVALGFTLHVDDFGIGYSKIAQLSRLPLRALKIDRSIVRDLASDGNAGGTIEAVMSLSRALRIKVIAEGVENAQQLELLRAHGCDEVQGFLFAQPMSAQAVRELSLPPPAAAEANAAETKKKAGVP